jgi:hypothetical protein
MRHVSKVTDAALLDLARRMADYQVRAAERSLTDAIETRGTLPARIAFLRKELNRGRVARAELFAIPRVT